MHLILIQCVHEITRCWKPRDILVFYSKYDGLHKTCRRHLEQRGIFKVGQSKQAIGISKAQIGFRNEFDLFFVQSDT